MSDTTTFPVKDPEEILDLTFLEEERLDGASIVAGSSDVTVFCLSDEDASDMLLGDSLIVGTSVIQRVQGGLSSRTYTFRLAFDTSDGRHLVEVGLLPVRTLG